jgi:hypothetical protein
MERNPFDPEVDDVGEALEDRIRERAEERLRELGTDENEGLLRDAPPDILTPIAADAPVSGHVVAPEPTTSAADSPEHDWALARDLVRPALRPVGTQGLAIDSIDRASLVAQGARSHTEPLIDGGLDDIPVVYTLHAGAFDILVNGDHLLGWGIEPAELRAAALANLAAWSASAPWSTEASGERRLVSSDTGDGLDAARILLPEARAHLAAELGADGARVLVGIPERHLLTAASLHPGDVDFVALFGQFVVEQSGGADEPIDRRVFELVAGDLVPFAG